MAFKQGLKLLNAFGLGFKHKVMLLIGQGYQVLRAVVCSDTIQVVDNPALGNRPAMSFFPDNDVFKNIASTVCSRMVSFYPYISSRFKPATSPPGGCIDLLQAHISEMTRFAPFRLPRAGGTTYHTSPSKCVAHRLSVANTLEYVKVRSLGIVWGFLLGAFVAWGLGLL